MPTYEVTTLEPKADVMLDDMENDQLIEKKETSTNGAKKKPLKRGSMKGLVVFMADDFDAPLEDFKEYV